jgi:hypothetical protein
MGLLFSKNASSTQNEIDVIKTELNTLKGKLDEVFSSVETIKKEMEEWANQECEQVDEECCCEECFCGEQQYDNGETVYVPETNTATIANVATQTSSYDSSSGSSSGSSSVLGRREDGLLSHEIECALSRSTI